MCRYDYFCFLIYNHLSLIAYSSIVFVYYMFCRILSTIYPYQHVCKTKRNTALLFAVVLISLFLLSLSLSPSLHTCSFISNLIDSFPFAWIYGYCISLLVVHICVSISMPPEMHLFAFCLSRSLYVCLSVGEPPDAMTGVA